MLTYKDAGVDIDAGKELVNRLQKLNSGIGGFGSLYPFGDHYLVSGTDGVGTKLKLAFQFDRHDTVGIDLVAMCVNDILTTGAKPLFFLDYFATSNLDVDLAERVIRGIIEGCKEAETLLLGGETAEMPGMYKEKEYDLSGFAVGSVKKEELIDGSSIVKGDRLVGIASGGLHSNGFSLVRKLLESDPGFAGPDELLRPTRIYVKTIEEMKKRASIKGIAHITGGGITENVPRMLPKGLSARIDRRSWEIPEVFHRIKASAKIEEEEMFKTFNMGIGLVAAVSQSDAESLLANHEDCRLIGEIVEE